LTAEQVTAEAKSRGGKWSRGKLTRIENNEWVRPVAEDVATLLDIYGVDDDETRAAYLALTRQARQRGWWVSYADVLGQGAYVGLELEAAHIRSYEALVIPGLLQTEDYARAITRSAGVSDEDTDRHVEARMLRKQILSRPDAPRLWAIIDEAALRKIPAAICAEQIRHLIDVQRPELRVQVMPDSAGLHAATSGSFTILDFAADPAVVYREDLMSSAFYEDPVEIAHCRLVYDHLQAAALGVDDSRAFLASMIQ
jgi:hypothetical protein